MFEFTKEELLQDLDFRSLTAKETYGKGAVFIMKFTLLYTTIHFLLLFLFVQLGIYTTKIYYHHFLMSVIVSLGCGLFASLFLSSMYCLYSYTKSQSKIREAMKKLYRNGVFFHMIIFTLGDAAILSCHPFIWEEAFFVMIFPLFGGLIITGVFMSFEVTRLSMGPAIELITKQMEKHQQKGMEL